MATPVIGTVVATTVAAAAVTGLVVAAVRGSGGNTATHRFSPGLAIVDATTGNADGVHPPVKGESGLLHLRRWPHLGRRAGDPDVFVEIDPRSGTVMKRFSPTSDVGAYAVEGKDLWEVGDTTLAMIDARLGEEVARYPLPKDPAWPGGQTGIAAARRIAVGHSRRPQRDAEDRSADRPRRSPLSGRAEPGHHRRR